MPSAQVSLLQVAQVVQTTLSGAGDDNGRRQVAECQKMILEAVYVECDAVYDER
jgi:hypothetical protein